MDRFSGYLEKSLQSLWKEGTPEMTGNIVLNTYKTAKGLLSYYNCDKLKLLSQHLNIIMEVGE